MDLARPLLIPIVLGALAIAVVCGAIGRRRRVRAWKALGRAGTLPGEGAVRWLLAIAAAGLALLGPRWGFATTPSLPTGHEVVLLVDTSRSMAAEDAVPDRLGAAVAGATAMVEGLGRSPGERVAVVAFAGRGVLRCPLTANLGAVREALSRLRPGDVRPGGTNLAAALNAAREAFPELPPEATPAGRSIVVFSDGENLDGQITDALEALRASGIVVHAVTIGDALPPGATVPVRDASGSVSELKYDGQTVHTHREDAVLKAIVAATGGTFIPLGLARPEDVATLYQTSIEPSERARREVLARGARHDRSAGFILVALVAGMSALVPAWGRPRWAMLAALGLLSIGADRPPAGEAGDRGLAAFQAGQLGVALKVYEDRIVSYPDDALLRFNAAVVLQRLGRHAAADARYAQALARAADQPALAARIGFARGNNAYEQGDREAALAQYDACLARPDGGDPNIQAIQRDAAVNRAFVARQTPDNAKSEEPSESGDTAAPREDHPEKPADEPDPPRTPAPPGTQGGVTSPADPEETDTPKTPEERLEQAVERIRQRNRPGVDPPPTPVDATRRDW